VNVTHLLFLFMFVYGVVCLFYVLSGVLVFVLLQVGKSFARLCEELFTILFFGDLH